VAPDWGEVDEISQRTHDIKTLLTNVARHLLPYFPDQPLIRVDVKCREAGPHVAYRADASQRYVIGLSAGTAPFIARGWDQFSLQFGHELGHILSNFEIRRAQENSWLEEAICDTASIFCLWRMSETWKTNAPYDNYWSDYASAFSEYIALNHFVRKQNYFSAWVKASEPQLRALPYGCDETVAARKEIASVLLTHFLKAPEHWPVIAHLPASDAPLSELLPAWVDAVPEKHKLFVKSLWYDFGIG